MMMSRTRRVRKNEPVDSFLESSFTWHISKCKLKTQIGRLLASKSARTMVKVGSTA